MHDLVIVGAGAAGLAAARTAIDRGLDTVLLEASHRIGGRAYTEEIQPGVPFDLGCHWLHSASRNPFVGIAERLGVRYLPRDRFDPQVQVSDRFAGDEDKAALLRYWQDCEQAVAATREQRDDIAVADAVDRDSEWVALWDYWISLMTSSDGDRVSAQDYAGYADTGENWPVTDGYGNLVARFGAKVPVALNTAVEGVALARDRVVVRTVRGAIDARTVLVTVSTGILASGRIAFDPPLPDWKQEAIAAIPLGNHNRIALVFDGDPFGDDAPEHVIDLDGDVPMLLHIKPYGHPFAVGATGGRFASWLERAGVEAAVENVAERLRRVFGGDVTRRLRGRIVTAWGTDPWTLGAYSTCLPGEAHQRAALAAPVDERLWFAGEATSREYFATCHGAYLTGVAAANAIADRLLPG